MDHPVLSAIVILPLLAALTAIYAIVLYAVFGQAGLGLPAALVIAIYVPVWFFVRIGSVAKSRFPKLGYLFMLSPQSMLLIYLIWIFSKSVFAMFIATTVFIIMDFLNIRNKERECGMLSEPKA